MARRTLDLGSHALKAPQHYHAQICCYERWENDAPQGKHCDVTVITNDSKLAVSQGKAIADLPSGHIANVIQCADEKHLEGIDGN